MIFMSINILNNQKLFKITSVIVAYEIGKVLFSLV